MSALHSHIITHGFWFYNTQQQPLCPKIMIVFWKYVCTKTGYLIFICTKMVNHHNKIPYLQRIHTESCFVAIYPSLCVAESETLKLIAHPTKQLAVKWVASPKSGWYPQKKQKQKTSPVFSKISTLFNIFQSLSKLFTIFHNPSIGI